LAINLITLTKGNLYDISDMVHEVTKEVLQEAISEQQIVPILYSGGGVRLCRLYNICLYPSRKVGMQVVPHLLIGFRLELGFSKT